MIRYQGADSYEVSILDIQGVFSKASLVELMNELYEVDDLFKESNMYKKYYNEGSSDGYKKGYSEAISAIERDSAVCKDRYEQGYIDGYNEASCKCNTTEC